MSTKPKSQRSSKRKRAFKPRKQTTCATVDELLVTVKDLERKGLESRTWNGRNSSEHLWLYFCNAYKLDSSPSKESAKLFIAWASRSGYKWSSISHALSAVNRYATHEQWAAIETDLSYRLVKDGAHKESNKIPTIQTKELNINDLVEIRDKTDKESYNGLMFYTLVLIGTSSLHRLGELVDADEKQHRSEAKRILRSSLVNKNGNYHYRMPSSKTDRFFKGRTKDIDLNFFPQCFEFKKTLERYVAARDAKNPNSPYLWVTEKGLVPTRSWFVKTIKKILNENYAGHSMRSGGATMMAEQGCSDEQIKDRGGWSTEAFQAYIRNRAFNQKRQKRIYRNTVTP
jgi:hypothetical protein